MKASVKKIKAKSNHQREGQIISQEIKVAQRAGGISKLGTGEEILLQGQRGNPQGQEPSRGSVSSQPNEPIEDVLEKEPQEPIKKKIMEPVIEAIGPPKNPQETFEGIISKKSRKKKSKNKTAKEKINEIQAEIWNFDSPGKKKEKKEKPSQINEGIKKKGFIKKIGIKSEVANP